jgi:hypothetical protein
MTRTRRPALCLTIALALTLGALVTVAGGHDYRTYYDDGTYPGRPHQERVFFGRHAPTGAFRDRFIHAQDQWDNITPRFQFIIYRDQLDTNAPDRCDDRPPSQFGQAPSIIDYQYYDGRGGGAAYVLRCFSPDNYRLEWFTLVVDTADDIYFGRGDAPDGYGDLGSLAVHELGHGAGWVWHYDSDRTVDSANAHMCRDHSDQLTMCRFIKPGTERMRTLQDHDRHTHFDAYNR